MNESEQPSPRPNLLRRIGAGIGHVELSIGALTLLIIFALVLLQAVQRYLPGEGFAGTGELARFSLIWLTFSAAGLLITSRGHIALEIVDAIPHPKAVRIVQVLALVIVAATAVGLCIEAWALIQTQGILRSPVMRLPMSVVYIPVLIGSVSTVIRSLLSALDIALHGPQLAEIDEDEIAAVNA